MLLCTPDGFRHFRASLQEELCVTISEIDNTGLLGHFLRFIGNEILVAFDKKDMKAIEELNQDFDILQSYVRYKIPGEIVENEPQKGHQK